jgi:hypothetical protein
MRGVSNSRQICNFVKITSAQNYFSSTPIDEIPDVQKSVDKYERLWEKGRDEE